MLLFNRSKYLLILLLTLILLCLGQIGYAFTETFGENSIENQATIQDVSVLRDYEIKVNSNGEVVELGSKGALIYEETTYLPIRKIAQAFGKSVDWNSETRTVILKNNTKTGTNIFDVENYINGDPNKRAIIKKKVTEEISWDGIQSKGSYTTNSSLLTVGNYSVKEGYTYNDVANAKLMYKLNNNSDYMTFSVISDVYGEPDYSNPYTLEPVLMTVFGNKIGLNDSDVLYAEDLYYFDHMVTQTINVTDYDSVLIQVYPGGLGHVDRVIIGDVSFIKDEEVPMKSNINVIVDNSVSIEVDGIKLNLKDKKPLIFEGTTYLPVRVIGEALGKKVEWDNTTRTVFLESLQTESEKVNNEKNNMIFSNLSNDVMIGTVIINDKKTDTVIYFDNTVKKHGVLVLALSAESNIEPLLCEFYGFMKDSPNVEGTYIGSSSFGTGKISSGKSYAFSIADKENNSFFDYITIRFYTENNSAETIIIENVWTRKYWSSIN